jgi:hypothetical protein
VIITERTMNHNPASRNEDLDEETPIDDELVADIIDLESQKRLWVRALIPLLQLRSRESDPSSRVQLALDLLHIAACERIRRLLRSDLPDEKG